jgi:predicted ATP-dependent endonuclease of OLD family
VYKLKIEEIKIGGIRSHKNTKCTFENYNALIGLNNCGKSNVLYALRWFFKDIKLTKDDISHNYTDSPFVEIKLRFEKNDKNRDYFDEEYIDNDTIIVKSYCDIKDIQNDKFTIRHQFIKAGIEPSKDKKIPFEEFVNIIYVPSIRELNDEIKLTTNSTINKLVSEYITSRIIRQDDKTDKYADVVKAIKKLSDYISTGENSAIKLLKNSLDKYMLDYNGIDLKIELSPPKPDEFVKNAFKISGEILNKWV